MIQAPCTFIVNILDYLDRPIPGTVIQIDSTDTALTADTYQAGFFGKIMINVEPGPYRLKVLELPGGYPHFDWETTYTISLGETKEFTIETQLKPEEDLQLDPINTSPTETFDGDKASDHSLAPDSSADLATREKDLPSCADSLTHTVKINPAEITSLLNAAQAKLSQNRSTTAKPLETVTLFAIDVAFNPINQVVFTLYNEKTGKSYRGCTDPNGRTDILVPTGPYVVAINQVPSGYLLTDFQSETIDVVKNKNFQFSILVELATI